MTSFDTFLTERERASTAFVEGDVGPLLAVSVADDPATIYPPNGAVVVGAEGVNGGNTAGAASFAPGAENRFEIVHSGSDGDLGYWTGLQHAKVRLSGQDEPIEMHLRITELFRHEDGAWRLIHRHADPLVTAET